MGESENHNDKEQCNGKEEDDSKSSTKETESPMKSPAKTLTLDQPQAEDNDKGKEGISNNEEFSHAKQMRIVRYTSRWSAHLNRPGPRPP